jgi:hypothetical protein
MKRLVVLLGILVATGCATVHPPGVAGTGTYSYVSGNLSWVYPADMERTWEATLRALETMDLRVEERNLDGLGGRLIARRADETKIRIRLKPETTRTTTVLVKVGTFGNKEQSENLHREIRTQLKL